MLGLQSGIVRFVALYNGVGDTKQVKGTIISSFVITALSSFIVGGLLFLFSRPISGFFNLPALMNILRIFAFAFPFYVIMLMTGYAARAFQLIKYEVLIVNICRPIANIIIVSMIFLLGFRLLGAVYGFTIAAVLSALLGIYLLTRIFPEIVTKSKPSYKSRTLLRFSLPLLVVGFANNILLQTDKIMLGYFKASQDLGIYAAAAYISQQTELITYSFSYIFSPIISDLYNTKKFGELNGLYKILTRWIVSLNLLFLILLISFSKQIMGIFGPEFSTGWIILVVLSCARLICHSAGGALPGYILPMSGKQDIELINAIIMGFLNIILNLWLIQAYGIIGAAIATGLSYALVNIVKIIEVRKLLGMRPYGKSFYKPFVAGFIVILISVFLSVFNFLSLHWILNIVILAVVYFVILYLLGLEHEDRVILDTIKRRIFN